MSDQPQALSSATMPAMTLIVSSLSARGRALQVGPHVVRILREAGWRVTVRVTTSDDDPVSVAAHTHTPFVGALGGDGFVAAVAEGIAQRDAIFVPIPAGRGNDLCRKLGVGSDAQARARSLAQTLHAVVGPQHQETWQDHLHRMDGMWVESADGKRLVVGVLSVGLEAVANARANNSWLRNGPLAYAWGGISTLWHFKGDHFRVRLNGTDVDMPGWVLSVSNSGMLGGGIPLSPTSDLFDGCLELVSVGQIPFREAMVALLKVVTGRQSTDKISVTPITDITITEPQGIVAMADGDCVAHVPLSCTVAPGIVQTLI